MCIRDREGEGGLLRVAQRDVNAEVGASGKVILLIGTGVELAHHHLARWRVERANTSCSKEAAGVVPATDTDRCLLYTSRCV